MVLDFFLVTLVRVIIRNHSMFTHTPRRLASILGQPVAKKDLTFLRIYVMSFGSTISCLRVQFQHHLRQGRRMFDSSESLSPTRLLVVVARLSPTPFLFFIYFYFKNRIIIERCLL